MKLKKLTACLLAGLMVFGGYAPFVQEFGNNTTIMADAANGINYFDFAFEFEKLDNGYYACYAKYNKDDYCTFWGFYNKDEIYSNSNGNYNGLSDDEKVSITSYTILSEIGGYPVKLIQGDVSIPNPAFKNCTALTSVTIPESITTIGRLAFYGCNCLKSVTVPPTVKFIEEKAIGYSTSGNVISDFIIYGENDSIAEIYAKENDITFKSLSEVPSVSILGDVDGNGTADAIDASYILQYAAYKGAGFVGGYAGIYGVSQKSIIP